MSRDVDLVLMDVHMDGIGGVEATRRIVTMRPEVVVILVSSYRAGDLAAAAVDCGAAAFLEKNRFGVAALREIWYDSVDVVLRAGRRAQP